MHLFKVQRLGQMPEQSSIVIGITIVVPVLILLVSIRGVDTQAGNIIFILWKFWDQNKYGSNLG